MNITVRKGDLTKEACDILIGSVHTGDKGWEGAALALDQASEGLLAKVAKEERFKATAGEVLVIRTEGVLPAKRVLLVGLGDKKEFNEERVRSAAASAWNEAKRFAPKKVISVFHGTGGDGLNAKLAAKAIVEGTLLADYSYGRYKKQEKEIKPPASFEIVTHDGKIVRAGADGALLGTLFANATTYARDLVNTPGQHMSPADLAAKAREIAKASKGRVRVKIFGKQELERMGAGGILGIAQGSDHEPCLAHLTYTPRKKSKRSVAFVGKAVTFDSGGLSLKPADAMMTMKLDMAGAADVLGVFSVIGALEPDITVHGIFGACENMPSGKAIRPGDVVKTLNGKTIEILNTDAEGRVTLADTLAYAVKQKPDSIIDLATLTGACMVALGEEITGLMANDRTLAAKVLESAEGAGEKMWELPLEKRYKTLITSDVADYKNIAGRYGGALTAGLLLEEFVSGLPWVHLDIAGPSFAERSMGPYMKKGATGHGVRTLLEFLRRS